MTRNRNFNRLIFFGMIFLVIGSTSLVFLPRLAVMPESWNDAVSGVFYGLAIAFMLLGMRRNAASRCGSQLPPAA